MIPNDDKKPSPNLHGHKKPPARVTGMQCLRCREELDCYTFARFSFLPYGAPKGNVMLVCPKCGHVEFMSQDSPLLGRLTPIASTIGDDD